MSPEFLIPPGFLNKIRENDCFEGKVASRFEDNRIILVKYWTIFAVAVALFANSCWSLAIATDTGTEFSEPCTCNDINDIQRTKSKVEKEIEALRLILDSFYGPNPPANWEEASKRFSDIVYGSKGSKPVAGVNKAGEPYVDKEFASKHCLTIAQSYIEHELEHSKQLDELSWVDGLHEMFSSQWWAKEMTKYEILAHLTQFRYLAQELESLKNECATKRQWECKCTGRTFDSQEACEGACSANLGCFVGICRETFKSYDE